MKIKDMAGYCVCGFQEKTNNAARLREAVTHYHATVLDFR